MDRHECTRLARRTARLRFEFDFNENLMTERRERKSCSWEELRTICRDGDYEYIFSA